MVPQIAVLVGAQGQLHFQGLGDRYCQFTIDGLDVAGNLRHARVAWTQQHIRCHRGQQTADTGNGCCGIGRGVGKFVGFLAQVKPRTAKPTGPAGRFIHSPRQRTIQLGQGSLATHDATACFGGLDERHGFRRLGLAWHHPRIDDARLQRGMELAGIGIAVIQIRIGLGLRGRQAQFVVVFSGPAPSIAISRRLLLEMLSITRLPQSCIRKR